MTAGPHGPGTRLTGVEALMWRLGRRDPALRPTMTLAVSCRGTIDETALVARLTRVCRQVPRLAERIVAGPIGSVPPRWEPDPHFDPARHVDVALAPPGTAGLLRVAESVLVTDFPAGRPPWRAVVVRSAAAAAGPGRSADHGVVLHLHHAYTDGLGGVRLVAELFDFEPGGAPATASAGPIPPRGSGSGAAGDQPGPGAAGNQPGPHPFERAWADLEEEAHRAVGLVGRAVPWAVRTVRAAAERPDEAVAAAERLVRGLRQQAGAATAPASPLLARRSPGARLLSLSVPVADLRETGRRLGATVNDVFLAGLLGGLRDWHRKHGPVPAGLRLAMPISTRDGPPGLDLTNALCGAVLRGPLGPLDFVETARLVHEIVAANRDQPWRPLVGELADVAARTPGAVAAVASALASLDVLASNVVGPPAPMWLGGAEVGAMIPIGPRSGAAVNATLLSYAGTAHIGLNVDPAAFGDPDVLLDCVEAAFAAGLEAGRR